VTGDDFGISIPVNKAISKAHENGILTTTSLMVCAPETQDAVARARSLPTLKVGLHLVLSSGRPCLPASEIPGLLNDDGEFRTNKVTNGIRMFFLPWIKQQLAAEIRAQFEAFRQTGLNLDHVNAHMHMHLHPTILDLIIRIGREFNLTAVRVPAEPLLDALIEDKYEKIRRRILFILYKPLVMRMQKKLKTHNLIQNERVYGLYDSGHMNINKVIRIISHLPDGLSELYTHPATRPWHGIERGVDKYEFESEYNALIHPRVKRTIEKFSIELTGFNG